MYRWLADGHEHQERQVNEHDAVGGLLAWRWRGVVWGHVPAVVWSLLSITVGLDCPLTPLEKHLRRLAGGHSYAGGFIDHYVEGVIYPERFTTALRALVAAAVVLGYAGLATRAGQRQRRNPSVSGASPTGRPAPLSDP